MGDDPFALETALTRGRLVGFIRDYVAKSGASGAVLGLSGGVDSALVAALATEAIGADKVLALTLPHRESDPTDEAHARLVADALGLALERVDITPIVDAVARACAAHPLASGPALANAKARARMVVLYAHANATNRLVLGTGNKSELLVGYFTKYGDGGADLYPIGDLYKTQVWTLAREMKLPAAIVAKPPSAGLFPGQTDEAELGIPYRDLDAVLLAFENGHDVATAARLAGVAEPVAANVARRVATSEHKRTSLVVPKLGFRTPGLDWRLPRSLERV